MAENWPIASDPGRRSHLTDGRGFQAVRVGICSISAAPLHFLPFQKALH